MLDIKQAHLVQDWSYERPLLATRFSPDGTQLITSAEDSQLQRWDALSGEKVVLAGHESWVHALQVMPDGQTLISGGCDGRLIWWPLQAALPTPQRTVEAHSGWIRAIELSPDGTRLASVGNDRQICLWDAHSGQRLAQWSQHDKHIYSVLFHPDGQQLLTGDLSGKIHLWNLADQQLVRSFDAAPLSEYNASGQQVDFGGVRSLALTPDGQQLLAAGLHKGSNPLGAVHEPLVLRFNFADASLLKSHTCDGIPGGVLWRIVCLSDGTAMAVCGGSSGGHLFFFDAEQDKDIHRFALPSLARDMDYHQPSQRVVSAHHDQHVRITHLHLD